jgi:hypothetical protein
MLDFHYAPSLRWRSDPSPWEEDLTLLHDLGVELTHSPSATLKLRARDDFSYTDDPRVEEDGVQVRQDKSYMLNRARAGVTLRPARLSEVDVYGGLSTKRYDESTEAELWDEDSAELGFGLWRQLGPTFGGKLVGRYYSYAYEPAVVPALGTFERDFTVLVGGLGMEKALSPQLRAGAVVGWANVEYKEDLLSSQSGPYGEVTLRGALAPNARFDGALSHSFRDSDAWPFPSQEYTQLSGRFEWDSSDVLTLGCSAVYRMGDYEVETDVPELGDISEDETVIVASVDATVKVGPRTQVKVAQRYEDVDSDVRESYTKNTTAVSLAVTF